MKEVFNNLINAYSSYILIQGELYISNVRFQGFVENSCEIILGFSEDSAIDRAFSELTIREGDILGDGIYLFKALLTKEQGVLLKEVAKVSYIEFKLIERQ